MELVRREFTRSLSHWTTHVNPYPFDYHDYSSEVKYFTEYSACFNLNRKIISLKIIINFILQTLKYKYSLNYFAEFYIALKIQNKKYWLRDFLIT